MRKKIVCLLLVTLAAYVAYKVWGYYAPPSIQQPYTIQKQDDDTLRIAYIGDSWAFMHRDHECLIAKIVGNSIHRPVRVYTFGISGLTSKEIYRAMTEQGDYRRFMQRGYDYCFISAGINDTYQKHSANYYRHSMEGIINLLLANGIRPIILEIPNYDILKAYERQTRSRKALRHLSMLVNGCEIDCRQSHRDALRGLLTEKELWQRVTLIGYRDWNNDFTHDQQTYYLSDGIHLNDTGYARLDSVIAQAVLSHETAAQRNSGYRRE